MAFRTDGVLLTALPSRGTDGAHVVDDRQKLLNSMLLEPIASEQPARVQRAPGKFERQYRLGCRSCSERIGYYCEPVVKDSTFLYVWPDKVTDRKLTQEDREKRARLTAAPEGSGLV